MELRVTKVTRHDDGHWTANVNGFPFETSGPLWFTRVEDEWREALPPVRRALVKKQRQQLDCARERKAVVV